MAVKREETDASLQVAEIALALAAHYLSPDSDLARFSDASLLLSGHLYAWDGWPNLSYEDKQRFGRLLALRPERFANPTLFARTMTHVLSGDRPRITSFVLAEDRQSARPVLAGDLDGLAWRLLADLEDSTTAVAKVPRLASAGTWSLRRSQSDRTGESVQVTIPAYPDAAQTVVPSVAAAAPRSKLSVSIGDLLDVAHELDKLRAYQVPYLHATLRGLLAGLRTSQGPLEDELLMVSGLLRILNAPTGTGKSVLMRVLAVYLARAGIRVAIVVPTIEASLVTAHDIDRDLQALAAEPWCTALMSPHRLNEHASKISGASAAEADWDSETIWRAGQLSYGCALLELMEPAARPGRGDEPCDRLHRPDGKGGMDKDHRSCPWRPRCPKFTQSRAALSAGVVVTNHHNFLFGKLQVPVRLEGRLRARMGISQFLLGAFDVVIVDEIDQFQSTAVDACAREMTLSSRARWDEGPLKKLDDDRSRIHIRDSLRITPALSRLRVLADQLVNFIADGELRIPGVVQGIHTTKWQLPNRYDRELCAALFGIDPEGEIDAGVYRRLDGLFPAYVPNRTLASPEPGDDEPLAGCRTVLQTLLAHPDEASLAEAKLALDGMLAAVEADEEVRAGLVTKMTLKAWFAALQHHVRELQGEAARLRAVDLASAREFMDGLATYALQGPFAYGPLGYPLVGFRFTGLQDPERSTELSLQTITGDPHAYTAHLGGLVALTLAGHQRIVLGLSATAFFPGAVREHALCPLTWWMTDADEDAITVGDGRVRNDAGYLQVSGRPAQIKRDSLAEMGDRLYTERVAMLLERLHATDPDRARVAFAVNSYEQCLHLARGIARSPAYQGGLCVAVPANRGRRAELLAEHVLPRDVVTLRAEEFEDFPEHGNMLVAPMARITRGLNIVVGIRSALSAIFLCVRPLALLTDPAEMFASINAAGHRGLTPSPEPSHALQAAQRRAAERLSLVLRAAPHFRSQDDDLQEEVVAGVIVDLIQLAGRARRGGTSMQLFLVDHAIHDNVWQSDMATIIRRMYGKWPAAVRADMAAVYGSALTSLLKHVALIDLAELP